MTDFLKPDWIFDGNTLRSDLAISISPNGSISAENADKCSERLRPISGIIAPGFVDLQVNGGGGVLFNQTPTAQGIRTIASAHAKLGTHAIMPTVITDHPDVMQHAKNAVLELHDESSFLGLHIEGPHISEAKRGTHKAEFLRPFSADTLAVVQELRQHNIPVIITLAPEIVSPTDIARLAETGAIVSLGHSNAGGPQVQTALDAGASCFTHLFNAMSQMQGRDPGMVGTAINSNTHVGMICDGIHVSDEMIQLALRARPMRKTSFLVSDAMPTVGGPNTFELYGQNIHVKDGALVNAEGNLAGAHTTMASGVARLVSLGIPLEEALQMAITVPANMIGREDLARFQGRKCDELIVLDTNGVLIHNTLADVL